MMMFSWTKIIIEDGAVMMFSWTKIIIEGGAVMMFSWTKIIIEGGAVMMFSWTKIIIQQSSTLHITDISSLGAFAKLRKTTISFVMSVCPSLRPSAWNNSAPAGRFFIKFSISVF